LRRSVERADLMSATLHHRVPNTYYGQWLEDSAAFYAGRLTGHCPQCDPAGALIHRLFNIIAAY